MIIIRYYYYYSLLMMIIIIIIIIYYYYYYYYYYYSNGATQNKRAINKGLEVDIFKTEPYHKSKMCIVKWVVMCVVKDGLDSGNRF